MNAYDDAWNAQCSVTDFFSDSANKRQETLAQPEQFGCTCTAQCTCSCGTDQQRQSNQDSVGYANAYLLYLVVKSVF